MKSDRVVRAGDTVRIVVPRFVVRVGYPKGVADYLPEVRARFDPQLRDFRRVGGKPNVLRRIEYDLAWLLTHADHFGGRQRSVHEVELPGEAGRVVTVLEVRSARTGTYYSPSGSGKDYEPGSLGDVRVVRLARVSSGGMVVEERADDGRDLRFRKTYDHKYYDEVDVRHLEKVQPEEPDPSRG